MVITGYSQAISQVGVAAEHVHEVREHDTPSDDSLFDIVPPAFGELIQQVYD